MIAKEELVAAAERAAVQHGFTPAADSVYWEIMGAVFEHVLRPCKYTYDGNGMELYRTGCGATTIGVPRYCGHCGHPAEEVEGKPYTAGYGQECRGHWCDHLPSPLIAEWYHVSSKRHYCQVCADTFNHQSMARNGTQDCIFLSPPP